jgi:hypothetical protein
MYLYTLKVRWHADIFLLSGPRPQTSHHWSNRLCTPHQPEPEQFSLHTSHRWTIQRQSSFFPPLTVGPISRLSPSGAKESYSRLLEEFSAVVFSSKWLPLVSHDVLLYNTSSPRGHPLLSKTGKQKVNAAKGPPLHGPAPYTL